MPPHPRKRLLRRVLTVSCWLAVGVAAALGVGRYLAVTSTVGVSIVSLAPWAVLPAGLAAGGLVVLSGWRRAALAGLVVAIVAWPQVVTYIPDQQADAAPIVTVMTANTLHGRADPDSLVATVRERGVEVLSVQELTVDSIDRLTAAGLDELLPYRSIAFQPGGTDVGLWSRYPLDDAQMLTGFAVNPVQAQITVVGRRLTVIAFHSKAPLYNNGTALWRADLDRLTEVMANPTTPTIVAGDFNATRDHRQFRDLLDAGYTDAGSDAGAGILATYPADRVWGPLVGIDHILVSTDLVGVDVTSVHQPGSDHRAVVATVAPKDITASTARTVPGAGRSTSPDL